MSYVHFLCPIYKLLKLHFNWLMRNQEEPFPNHTLGPQHKQVIYSPIHPCQPIKLRGTLSIGKAVYYTIWLCFFSSLLHIYTARARITKFFANKYFVVFLLTRFYMLNSWLSSRWVYFIILLLMKIDWLFVGSPKYTRLSQYQYKIIFVFSASKALKLYVTLILIFIILKLDHIVFLAQLYLLLDF